MTDGQTCTRLKQIVKDLHVSCQAFLIIIYVYICNSIRLEQMSQVAEKIQKEVSTTIAGL